MSFLTRTRLLGLGVLLTAAATYLWAHEGHATLKAHGVAVDADHRRITLEPAVMHALGLRTAEVDRRPWEDRLPVPARVGVPWDRHAFVSVRVAGAVVVVRVRPGDRVAAGQPLAEVESAELSKLQLEDKSAGEEARLAEANLRALEAAATAGSVGEQVLAQARSQAEEQRVASLLARRKLTTAGGAGASESGRLEVRSPISGVVLHADVQPGQSVEPAQHLFEVIDASEVWVEADVLPRDLPRVAVGTPVEFRGPGVPPLRAAVSGKDAALSPVTQTGTVWAAAVQGGGGTLRPGMRGLAELVLPAQAVTAVPAAALVGDGAARAVFVESGPGQYERKEVVTGRESGMLVEVRGGGVYPGDRVVTTGCQELATFLPETVLRPGPETAERVGLRVEPARPRRVAEVVEAAGVVELPPGRRAVVTARRAGTVGRVLVGRDARVRAGDVLGEVVSLELEDAQLELVRAQLQADLIERTLRPMRDLAASGSAGASARQLRDLESALRTARLRCDSLETRLRTAGLTDGQVRGLRERAEFVDALPVRAPADGYLARFQAALGQAVKAEDPLFEIHDPAGAEVRAEVPERDAARVRVGDGARVRLATEPSVVRDGEVVRVGPLLGAADRGLDVWVSVPSLPAGVPHGVAARVSVVVGESAPALAVPVEAVVKVGTRAYVFVRRPDGRFDRRAVALGRGDDRYVAVTSGLRDGEPVAVRGVAELQTSYAGLK
jgi:cobalt-zinc-cadmium efflux system membrane fusion protein